MSTNEQKKDDPKLQEAEKDTKKIEGPANKPAYKGNNPGGASSK